MPSSFLYSPIIPSAILSNKRVRGTIWRALQLVEQDIVKSYAAIIRTWNHKPVIQKRLGYAGGDAFIEVWTDDEVFGYLNKGTNVRWAVMTNPFRAKTAPRFIGSATGVGGLAYVRSKTDPRGPMPGIKARNWTIVIRSTFQPIMEQKLADAMVRGVFGKR